MTAIANYFITANNKAIAICQFCGHKSGPVAKDQQGEPDIAEMKLGWSVAFFAVTFKHSDSSTGSRYTCGGCNHLGRTGLPFKRSRFGTTEASQ